VERQAVVATLRSQGGHRRRTAEALGIGLRTLGVKLSQWRVARQLPPGI
jgi:DNA-binding NtrC family response regulator